MIRINHWNGIAFGCWAIGCLFLGVSGLAAPPTDTPRKQQSADGPAAQVASATADAGTHRDVADPASNGARDSKTPLKASASRGPRDADILHVLHFARAGYQRMTETIHDYTCVIYKREPLENPRDTAQYMQAKIRHERRAGDKIVVPFSVYLHFLKPKRVEGREVLYVRGQYHDDIIARRGGRRSPNMTLELDPKGPLAMEGNRYPITEIGMKNLTKKLIGVLEKELTSADCEVKSFRDAKLNNRPCIHFQVRHTTRRPEQRYYMARVLVDEELRIPVYFASYDWPKKEGGKPQLLEEYAYLNIKVNAGLTDRDFDVTNPKYHFKQIETPTSDMSREPDDDTNSPSVPADPPDEPNQPERASKGGT